MYYGKKIQITYLSLRIILLSPLKFTTVHIVVDAAGSNSSEWHLVMKKCNAMYSTKNTPEIAIMLITEVSIMEPTPCSLFQLQE